MQRIIKLLVAYIPLSIAGLFLFDFKDGFFSFTTLGTIIGVIIYSMGEDFVEAALINRWPWEVKTMLVERE